MGGVTIETTDTAQRTLQLVLDQANPNELEDALQYAKLGTTLTPLKRTFTGLASATSFDLTQIDGTGEVAGPGNPNRLPALDVVALRVTTGAAGTYMVTDAAGTAIDPSASMPKTPGIATLSADGKTVTFNTAATAFVIEYIPNTQPLATWQGDFAPAPAVNNFRDDAFAPRFLGSDPDAGFL